MLNEFKFIKIKPDLLFSIVPSISAKDFDENHKFSEQAFDMNLKITE